METVTFARPGKIRNDQVRSVKEYLSDECRMVFLQGAITGDVSQIDCANLLLALAAHSSKPIKMFITSPGGVIDTTMMIYDTMKLIDVPIITVGRYCASAAAILMSAGTERYLFPQARMMLHLASGQMTGDAEELRIQQEEMEKTQQGIITALIENGVKKTRAQILKDINREKWFNAQESIDYGMADGVVTKELLKGWLTK